MIPEAIRKKILSEFDEKSSLYESFTEKQEKLISELLHEQSFTPHSVRSRMKRRESLKGKLEGANRDYSSLGDITDISGVRIITYFSEEVDKVAGYIEREFQVLKQHSLDKRQTLDPDRFGYLSLHYVVRMSPARLALTEYRKFVGLTCEIQIRSILQHAWPEIEHDLGYKSKVAIPKAVQRRFSRLASLLELADEEFAAIRKELSSYEKALPRAMEEAPGDVTLDKLSLSVFLHSNPVAKALDEAIASIFDAQIGSSDAGDLDVRILAYFGIQTVAELDDALMTRDEEIRKFAKLWIGDSREEFISQGIWTLYLGYVLAGRRGDFDYAKRFAEVATLEGEGDDLARDILETYAEIKRTG